MKRLSVLAITLATTTLPACGILGPEEERGDVVSVSVVPVGGAVDYLAVSTVDVGILFPRAGEGLSLPHDSPGTKNWRPGPDATPVHFSRTVPPTRTCEQARLALAINNGPWLRLEVIADIHLLKCGHFWVEIDWVGDTWVVTVTPET